MTKPPPGDRGLPLLGETLDFMKGPGPFVKQRFAKHGCPFKSNVIFTTTVFLKGADAAELFLDDSLVSKVGSVPPPLMKLFSGDGLVNMIDDDAHRVRRQLLLAGFDEAACLAYVPALERVASRFFERWAATPGQPILDDLKSLCIESIGSTMFGIEDPTKLDVMKNDTITVLEAMTALPVQLPGTKYSRGVAAMKRIVRNYTEYVGRAAEGTGAARIRAARIEGQSLDSTLIARELHHAVIAGYIVFAELVATFVQLDRHPQVRDAVVRELRDAGLEGALDPATLQSLPVLDRVVSEIKRVTPNVPVAFWKARKTFEFRGATIQKGWGLVLCTTETSVSEEHWADPLRFDPERFAPGGEAEQAPHAFAVQGVGPMTGHKCLGFHFSSTLMRVFTALACRDWEWTLPEQDRSLTMAQIPPEPRSGLVLELRAR